MSYCRDESIKSLRPSKISMQTLSVYKKWIILRICIVLNLNRNYFGIHWSLELDMTLSMIKYPKKLMDYVCCGREKSTPCLDSLGRFKRLDAQCLSFDDHPLTHPTEIFPVTDNIGQILTLQFKNSSMTKKLVITNCLLFWRPTAHFVRLRQAWVLYKEALKVNQDILIMAGGNVHRPFIR
jgi:hypothetical protein